MTLAADAQPPTRARRADPLRADAAPLESTALPRTAGGWSCVYADPPWRFTNRTGKVAPEHRRLDRYDTMSADQIAALPVADVVSANAHLYLWVPNALLPEGLAVMQGWGFRYVSNLVWAKRRKDGGPDGRGVGFYFRNVTELILFGTRGNLRTLPPGRRQVNLLAGRKREHSRKPDGLYEIIEACSPGPYLELFARHCRPGWTQWGNEIDPAQLALAPLLLDTPSKRESPARARSGTKPDQLALNGHAGGEGDWDGD
jgi:N6-adenosine-specific RNA methylase IME4